MSNGRFNRGEVRKTEQALEPMLAVKHTMTVGRGPTEESPEERKVKVTRRTSVPEAVRFAKKSVVISRIPVIAAALIVGVITWRAWKPDGGWGQFVAVGLVMVALLDSARLYVQERGDPAIGEYSDGVLRFHWISGRSVEVPVSRVRRIRFHENPYWQFRRVYPKWFEVDLAGEPKRIIVPDSNLKPEARELLTRLSRL
ncbi:MAG TPA: hypothetical protein ENK19_05125 [Acidobacteria bacterium]|nr:hypothetical protein [Acidobacteriota bacterium]